LHFSFLNYPVRVDGDPAGADRQRRGGQMEKSGSAGSELSGRPSVIAGRHFEIIAGIEQPGPGDGLLEGQVLVAV
jgi:hypothetical protein